MLFIFMFVDLNTAAVPEKAYHSKDSNEILSHKFTTKTQDQDMSYVFNPHYEDNTEMYSK